MAATSGPATPDRDRAETCLRLQAEAELQRALGFRHGVVPDILEWRQRRDEIRPIQRSRAGEHWLSSGWKVPGDPRPATECLLRISTLGRALAAAGAIDDATAAEVLADLQAALAVRSLIPKEQLLGSPMRSFASLYFPGQRMVRTPRSPAVPVRLMAAGTVATVYVENQPVRVCLGSMVIDGASATVSITARLASGHAAPAPLPVAWEILNSCTATDDLGSSYGLHFSGSGADDNWAGRLHVSPAPPAILRWLDFSLPGADPVRLRLDATPRVLPTSTLSLPAGESADRYLDAQTVELLAADDGEDGKDPLVVWAARGLLEAGVLTPLNPALRRLTAVASQLGLELPVPLAVIPPGPLPADWLSLLDRWDCHDGPTGIVPVAAHLPELGGAQCAITDIQSAPEVATIQLHARGWPEPSSHQPWRDRFRWSARDDVGGWYVTSVKGWSFSDSTADLTLGLRPAINPAARQLQVILSGRTGEVSMNVPLDWQEGL